MSAAIHFYDAVTAGKNPAEGQLVRYDSLLCSAGGEAQSLEMAVRLREDVHVDLEAAADSELAGLDLLTGETELEWARLAHAHFSVPGCLHVGLGNTTRVDPFIRYALYRNLMPYPCVGLPPGARFLDLETIARAITLLRPDEMPWKSAPDPVNTSALHHFLMWEAKIAGGNRAARVRDLFSELNAGCPKLVEHSVKLSSLEAIKTAMGLDDGEVSDLGSATPCFLAHPSIAGRRGFLLCMPVAADITYPDVLFVADLESDLSRLCDPAVQSYQELVRSNPRDLNKPLVRIPLGRLPSCAPIAVLRSQDAQRLQVSVSAVKANIAKLRGAGFLPARLKDDPILELAAQPADVYYRLWAGDFSSKDVALMTELHRQPVSEWLAVASKAQDGRFRDLVIRLVAREAPQFLTSTQREACAAYASARRPENLEAPFWLAGQIKQAQNSERVPPAAVGLVQLHERLTRNIG